MGVETCKYDLCVCIGFELLKIKWFTQEKKSHQLSDSLKVKANIGEIVWYINHFNQVAVYS